MKCHFSLLIKILSHHTATKNKENLCPIAFPTFSYKREFYTIFLYHFYCRHCKSHCWVGRAHFLKDNFIKTHLAHKCDKFYLAAENDAELLPFVFDNHRNRWKLWFGPQCTRASVHVQPPRHRVCAPEGAKKRRSSRRARSQCGRGRERGNFCVQFQQGDPSS